jgi:hypothetical protein
MKAPLRSALVAASLAACHSSTPSPAAAPAPATSESQAAPAVTLERTPCFGRCPVYSVSISRSGLITYEGKRFVADSGADSARIAPEAVDSLLAELDRGGYFGLDDHYVSGAPTCGPYATDLPSANSSANDGTRSKRIQHDHGCSHAPSMLSSLEKRIDEVAGTSRWTGH